MKKIIFILLALVLIVSGCTRRKKTIAENGSVRIESSESIFSYQLKARFPEERTIAVRSLLASKLDNADILTDRSISRNTKLLSGTRFNLKFKTGRLEIKIKKNGNTESDIDEVRNLGKSVQRLLLNP